MFHAKYPLLLVGILVFSSQVGAQDKEDFHTQMMRGTVKISHEKSTATGFLLSADQGKNFLLVTAAHVFENTPDDQTTVLYRIKNAEADYTKLPVKTTIRHGGQPAWRKHPSEDVAVLRVQPPENADLAVIATERLASDEVLRQRQIHPGESLICLGYPHREEGSKAGFPLLRSGPIASFPLLPTAKTKTFYLSANTFEGDSGGPVYASDWSQANPEKPDQELIVGLVIGQQILNEELKMIYGTTKVQHRLGLAIIVHASFIRETIDLLDEVKAK